MASHAGLPTDKEGCALTPLVGAHPLEHDGLMPCAILEWDDWEDNHGFLGSCYPDQNLFLPEGVSMELEFRIIVISSLRE